MLCERNSRAHSPGPPGVQNLSSPDGTPALGVIQATPPLPATRQVHCAHPSHLRAGPLPPTSARPAPALPGHPENRDTGSEPPQPTNAVVRPGGSAAQDPLSPPGSPSKKLPVAPAAPRARSAPCLLPAGLFILDSWQLCLPWVWKMSSTREGRHCGRQGHTVLHRAPGKQHVLNKHRRVAGLGAGVQWRVHSPTNCSPERMARGMGMKSSNVTKTR